MGSLPHTTSVYTVETPGNLYQIQNTDTLLRMAVHATVPALRQEDPKFRVRLIYTGSSRPPCTLEQDPISKTPKH